MLRLEQMRKRVEEEVSDSDMELFAVGRSEGTREPNGQRVLQVCTVQCKPGLSNRAVVLGRPLSVLLARFGHPLSLWSI